MRRRFLSGLSISDAEQVTTFRVFDHDSPRIVPTLSVVMPAYNEEGAIAGSVADVREFVFPLASSVELVVVNDGSRDQTGPILDKLTADDARVRVIHQANAGHGNALITAMNAARGDWLLLIDSDRQIPLESFAQVWVLHKYNDAVFGVRRRRHDHWIRKCLTRIIRFVLWPLFRTAIYDANIPFKLVKRDDWKLASEIIPQDTLAPSLFLAIFLVRTKRTIAEVDVPHRDRETGTVSIQSWKLVRFCWKAFVQLLSFRRRLETWASPKRF